MTNITRPSIFPATFITAREKANAAWDAAEDAREHMSKQPGSGSADIDTWLKVGKAALAAQADFEAEVAGWRRLNGLD